jgi:Zn-dependent protease with chaperone function
LYENEIKLVKGIMIELVDKAKLKKIPKLLVSKDVKLAAVRGFRNQLIVGEYLLSKFQKRVFNQDDVKATIAHEIGHLMPSNLPWYHRIFKYTQIVIVYIALMFAVFFGLYFSFSSNLLPFLLVLIGSLPFLPWCIKTIERPFETEADRNASELIGNETLAKSIIRKAKRRRERSAGPVKTLEQLENMLSHPPLNERLELLGYKLKLALEKT